MNRRTFVESVGAALAWGGIFLLLGCSKKEAPARLGNQQKLWDLATSGKPLEAPLELPYAKDTPAFFRDASLARQDSSFKAKVSGG